MKLMLDQHSGTLSPILIVASWFFSILSIPMTIIPVILSSIASIFAIVNYYYQIKKNK